MQRSRLYQMPIHYHSLYTLYYIVHCVMVHRSIHPSNINSAVHYHYRYIHTQCCIIWTRKSSLTNLKIRKLASCNVFPIFKLAYMQVPSEKPSLQVLYCVTAHRSIHPSNINLAVHYHYTYIHTQCCILHSVTLKFTKEVFQ